VSAPKVGVAIVSYNTAPLLRRCLESVVADTDGPVLVVDNGSTDGSAELVRREFSSVGLRVDPANRGYGSAANVAVGQLGTPYVLLLNADTELSLETVSALGTYLDGHSAAAIAGPRLVDDAGSYEPSAHRFPTPVALLMQETGIRRRLRLAHRHQWRPRSVDWILGAALAIRREAFEAVGGFDEGYFLYQEEVDICYRLHAAGWEIHYAPVATVLHVGGASTAQQKAQTFGQYVRSTQRFGRLRLSRTGAAGVRVVLAAVLVARVGRDAIRFACTRERERRENLRDQINMWLSGLQALRA
jgi:GT2 family glycosyltransferase